MRKKLLMKSLLVAAALCVGGNAWATPTVIKTYDFDAATDAVATQTTLAYSGTTTINKTACDNLTGDFEGVAVQGAGSWHVYHTNSKGVLQGKGYYNNNGGGRLLGLIGLKSGDIVTISASGGLATSATNATYDAENSTEGTNGIYTVTEDGNFAVSVTRYFYIHTITVTRDLADLEVPTYTITRANGTQRQVSLACLTDGAAIKYNTVSDKSAAGWTTYTVPFYTAEATLYAYSEKGTNTSEVITITTGAGSAITLNAPKVSASFVLNASTYNPIYTFASNQSDILGLPETTITYSFDGGEATEGTSYAPTTSGSLKVTVSADGYTSNSTVLDVVGGNFIKTYSFDAINDVTVDTSTGTWENASNVNGAQWTFTDLTNCTYTLRDDIVLTGFKYARATTAQTKQGFYARLGSGSVEFSLNSAECIAFTMLGGNTLIAKGTSTSQAIDHYSNIRAIDIYTPASFSSTITSAGWATLYTPYALDFSGVEGLTAYTAALSGSTVTLTAVDNVPANTGVVLKGDAKTYSIPAIASSTTAKGDLEGSTTAVDVTADDANVYYVLAKTGDEDARFAKVSTGSIAAGKAYLKVAKAAAREFFAIGGDDVTAIESVKAQQMNGEVYNLNGQRVAAPQKGLYIVNGKKVVLK